MNANLKLPLVRFCRVAYDNTMCGIVGVINGGAEVIISALQKLKYRGYDSFGVAVVDDGVIVCEKRVGEVRDIDVGCGEVGIGHTRWATNGRVCVENAHPLVSGTVAVVQNGIVENYADIRARYANFPWTTDTDTESILAVISGRQLDTEVVAEVLGALEGEFAILFLDSVTESIYFAKKGSNPILIDVELGIIASDISVFSSTRVIEVADGQFGRLSANGLELSSGEIKWRECVVPRSDDKKMTHESWFESEFFEQVEVLRRAHEELKNMRFPVVKSLDIIGCGSAYIAGKVGEWWFNKISGIRAKASFSSEACIEHSPCVAAVSQSGETADTLKALRKAKNATKVGLINAPGSTMCGCVDVVIPTLAGREISVASTKSTTCQMLSMLKWACDNADALSSDVSATDPERRGAAIFDSMDRVFLAMEECMRDVLSEIEAIDPMQHVFVLGSGGLLPIAMEAALKIKELAYVHAEGMSSSEMKHGPLALVSEDVLVICFCPHWEPIIDEVASRGARVVIFTHRPSSLSLPCGFSARSTPALPLSLVSVRSTPVFPFGFSVPIAPALLSVRSSPAFPLSLLSARSTPALPSARSSPASFADRPSSSSLPSGVGVSNSSSPSDSFRSSGIRSVQMPEVDELYAPFVYILAAQWLANSWGKKRGNRIDMPRNLAKSVTVV